MFETSLRSRSEAVDPQSPHLDRTAKLYIGGKQARPDSGYSYTVRRAADAPSARPVSAIARTFAMPSRRRITPPAWATLSGHARAQVLYYLAENLEARSAEFAARLVAIEGGPQSGRRRGSHSRSRASRIYAAHADK